MDLSMSTEPIALSVLLGVYLLNLHLVLQQLLLQLHLLDVDAVGGRRPLLEDI